MKKLIFVILLVALIAVPASLWAATRFSSTTNAKSTNIDYASGGTIAITDQVNGYTQRVDDYGYAGVTQRPHTLAVSTGSTLDTGVALYTGACRVSSITCSGVATANTDSILIYDATSATGTPKFECSYGTAKETINIAIPEGGVMFSTGIFAASNRDAAHIAVSYDY